MTSFSLPRPPSPALPGLDRVGLSPPSPLCPLLSLLPLRHSHCLSVAVLTIADPCLPACIALGGIGGGGRAGIGENDDSAHICEALHLVFGGEYLRIQFLITGRTPLWHCVERWRMKYSAEVIRVAGGHWS